MSLILLGILALSCAAMLFVGFRGTILEVSWRRGGFAGLLIFRETFLLVVLGVFLFEIMGLDVFPTFYVTQQSRSIASFDILAAILVLFCSISLFSRTIFKKYMALDCLCLDVKTTDDSNERLLLMTVGALLVVVLVVLHAYGMRHAFLRGIFSGDLMGARLANRYSSSAPTVIMSYYKFLYIWFAVLTGLHLTRLSKASAALCVALVIFSSSLLGSKGGIVMALLVCMLAYLSVRRPAGLGKMLVLVGLALVSFYFAVFFVTRVQFPDLDIERYNLFLLHRIGVGQIHGVYEQYALKLRDSSYILHAIPFANYLAEYNIYNKDLMMNTWGASSAAEDVGVMNSFFIGEAFAIGGRTLVAASPIIVALNYCGLFVLLMGLMKYFLGISRARSSTSVRLAVVPLAAFTGDIGGLLFFKLGIMFLFFMVPIIILFRVIKMFRRDE